MRLMDRKVSGAEPTLGRWDLVTFVDQMMTSTETSTVLLADLIAEWIGREPARAPETLRRDRWAARFILDFFGEDRDVESITKAEVHEFKSLCKETFSGSTPRVVLRLLVRPLEVAYLEDRISRCVVGGMSLSKNGGSG